MAGYYTNHSESAGANALHLMQNSISNLAQIQRDTQKAVSENLKSIGESIKDYGMYRMQLDKMKRDEAFRQSEFDEKNRQFKEAQAESKRQFDKSMAQKKYEFDAEAPNRAANANDKNASATLNRANAKKVNFANLGDEKNQAQLDALNKQIADDNAKQSAFLNKLENDNFDTATTTTPQTQQGTKKQVNDNSYLLGLLKNGVNNFTNRINTAAQKYDPNIQAISGLK